MVLKTLLIGSLLLLPASAQSHPASAQSHPGTAGTAATRPGVLQSTELQTLVPATVFFSGQTATVQLRNSGGVRGDDGKLTLVALVDTGGYSSGLKEKYQFYLLTDTPIEIDGKRLSPGAYGGGFLSGTGLEVMDLGGNELFHGPVQHDAGMTRPRPLQVVAGSAPGESRLYLGRDYVVFRQIKP